jgi:hypothetical protein
MDKTPESIQHSIDSIVASLANLAKIEAKSIATDREEKGGVLCYNPKTKKSKIIDIDGTNDSVVNKPSLTVNEITELCPKDQALTFWHTHGTMLHSFSDLDRYSAADLAASGKKIGLCSLGINGIQCHYAFLSIPQVVNIRWNGELEKHIKKISKSEHLVDDLMCDAEMNCRRRYWPEGMGEPVIGTFDQVNLLKGASGSIGINGGIIATSHTGLVCYSIDSEDGFKSFNCFGRDVK